MDLELEKTDDVSDFAAIAVKLTNNILSVGEIDYEGLRAELKGLSVRLESVFSPQELANDLAKIQAYKDRAIEIVNILSESHLTHKRVVEILTAGWAKYSQEKSAERREGEAQLKLSSYIMSATKAEIAYKCAVGIMQNLESQQETVSRQISCVQAAAKILDRRYAYDGDRPLDRGVSDDRMHSVMAEARAGMSGSNQCDNVTNWDTLPSE
jgi:hypothetical protein